MATISIIIPAYNPGAYLREAIRSVHQQTFSDWELVVVDDASSEDLGWVRVEFPKVRLIRQAHGGASVARNNGILATTGGLIAFMDQDDLWRPQKLERQVAAMLNVPDLAVCYSDLSLIDADGKLNCPDKFGYEVVTGLTQPSIELDGCSTPAAEELSNLHKSVLYFSSRFVVPSTVMIRRSCLATSGLLDPFIPFSGDFDLLIKLGSRHKVARIASKDVLYRKHANNFSDQYEVGRGEVEALIGRFVSYAKATGDHGLAKDAARLFRRPRKIYSAQAFDRARYSLREKQYRDFLNHLGRAFLFSPGFVIGSLSRWIAAHLKSANVDNAAA